jgi:cathepsin A (carboxypeptidase C)
MFGELSSEAKAVWDEVAMLAPESVESFKKQVLGAKPKPSTRRPDHKWDHVVKGADVQAIWAQDENGESYRPIGGDLENHNLRVKSVDPSKLGVDSVKQYSGYLDNEANDKHLFYCKWAMTELFSNSMA